MIRLVRSSAIKARTQAANQLQALVETAPARLRERLRHHSVVALVDHALRCRTGKIVDPDSACRGTLAPLARRWRHLDQEIDGYDRELRRLTTELCPELLERVGVGPEVASCLLVAAGDNPERLKSEACFAALCGVSPLDASSGRQRRHRLNRGGNRNANRALWVIAFVRLRMDARTKVYAARRTEEGRSRSEITRCLKRYIVREGLSPPDGQWRAAELAPRSPLDKHRSVNAVMESFFSTVKSELGEHFDSHGDAKMELFDYIEVFYNQRRRHSTLGQISPAAFERQAA